MTETAPWFKDWFNSPYYHQLYFKRDEKEAASFIDKLIDHLKPAPDSLMLDIACGRGRHSRMLAAKGFNVTGIDLSTDSIKEAKKYESENLQFFLHDMRLPFWINYFDYAFNFFTSFGYFNTRREHDNAIRTIAQSIKPNGTFVIDYLNVHYAEDHLVHKSEIEIDDVTYFITKWFDETHFYKKIVIEDDKLERPI
jgi:2-polyprenyl-3-methyl-5-hydroxy-6-metoxy-1,4-benzoquinol methylase